jgi:hypothetical protein
LLSKPFSLVVWHEAFYYRSLLLFGGVHPSTWILNIAEWRSVWLHVVPRRERHAVFKVKTVI